MGNPIKKPSNFVMPEVETVSTQVHSMEAVVTDGGLFHANPLDAVPLDTELPFPIYVHVSDYYVLFRNMGDQITSERVKLLRHKKLNTVYIPKASWAKFLETLENSLNLEDTAERETTAKQLRNVVVAYEKEWETKCQILSSHFTKFQIWGSWLARTMREEPIVGLKVLKHFSDPTLYYVNHSFNVAIYSAFIGYHLKMSEEDVKQMVIAALLHNAGNVSIPKNVLFKIEPLETIDWEVIQTHTLKGGDMLRSIGAPQACIDAAEMHHERIDGKGYPKALNGDEIHPFAKIISVADVYDALLSPRPHAPEPFYPSLALDMMSKMEGKFDEAVFGFINKVGGKK